MIVWWCRYHAYTCKSLHACYIVLYSETLCMIYVITQVDQEYHILTDFTKNRVVPVPQPLYRSTAQDRQAAGVDFIIMSYVEVWADSELHNLLYTCMCACSILLANMVFWWHCLIDAGLELPLCLKSPCAAQETGIFFSHEHFSQAAWLQMGSWWG